MNIRRHIREAIEDDLQWMEDQVNYTPSLGDVFTHMGGETSWTIIAMGKEFISNDHIPNNDDFTFVMGYEYDDIVHGQRHHGNLGELIRQFDEGLYHPSPDKMSPKQLDLVKSLTR